MNEDKFRALLITLTKDKATELLSARPATARRPTETYAFDTFALFSGPILHRLRERQITGYLLSADIIAMVIPYGRRKENN
jgi:hypothetical protein